jgi:hypothetical protein
MTNAQFRLNATGFHQALHRLITSRVLKAKERVDQ